MFVIDLEIDTLHHTKTIALYGVDMDNYLKLLAAIQNSHKLFAIEFKDGTSTAIVCDKIISICARNKREVTE